MKNFVLKNLTAAMFLVSGIIMAHASGTSSTAVPAAMPAAMPMAMPTNMPISATAAKPVAKPATPASAAAAIKSAEDADNQANTLGVEWNTVPKLLKAAHDAEASGYFATAQKKATNAEVQAKTAIAEAHEQATLWRTQVIH